MTSFSFHLPAMPIRNLAIQKKLARGICLLCLLAFGYQVRYLPPDGHPEAWIRILSRGCFILAACNGILLLLPGKRVPTHSLPGKLISSLTPAWLTLVGLADFLLGFTAMGLLLALILGGLLIQGLVEKRASIARKLVVDPEGVRLPGPLFSRFHRWGEMNRILLAHGLITLDLKTNRVIQLELTEDPDPEIQGEFNEFCQEMLRNPPQSPS